MNNQTEEILKRSLVRVTQNTAAALGTRAEISFDKRPYPALHNDPFMTKRVVQVAEDVLGNKQSFGEIVAYANRNEAYHATASSPEGEGAYLTMKQAIEKANLSSEDISFVHAHGTATPTNDESELNALKRIFKHKIPAFASSKSYVGHTLGAAGALNAIYTLLAMQHSFLFENLNFDESIDGINEPIRKFTSNFPIQYAISNAFGFGGNNNSIVFANTQKGGSNAI